VLVLEKTPADALAVSRKADISIENFIAYLWAK